MNKKKRGSTTQFTVNTARELRRQATHAEKILWDALRGRKLAGLKFRRQHPLDRFVLDMLCAEKRLAIEIDGGGHQNPYQAEYDKARSQFLLEKGIQVMRFTNQQIEKDLPNVLKQILAVTNSPSPDEVFRQEKGQG
jgi:very-short-patch-repair endonuclease